MLTRAELLGELMRNYKESVAVSGTHGKTTTTSMITDILLAADTDPTISVGGILKDIGGNIRVGGPDLFVTEACEYTNSFLSLYPTIEVILNIEEDHLDFFKDLADIRHSFRRFAENTAEGGTIIINGAITDYEEIVKDLPVSVVTYGLTEACDYYPSDITFDAKGCATYTAMHQGRALTSVKLNIPGMHNVSNSLAVIAAALSLKIELSTITSGISQFTGTDRRFELKGIYKDGVTVIDDYAHHPTEIAATLTAAIRIIRINAPFCVFRLILISEPRPF